MPPRPLTGMLRVLCVAALACEGGAAQARLGPTLVTPRVHGIRPKAGRSAATRTRTKPIFSASGGHPGGCITGVDEALGETWYFHAPPAVVQQLPAAVNGTISFSLKQSGTAVSLIDDDIVITGPAGRLSYRFPTAPGTDWTDFSVRLSASEGWTWNWNARATQAQIESVLAAPRASRFAGNM